MGQIEVFEEIWNTREHICEVCGKEIKSPKAQCFSHRLAKGSHPKWKLDENNIGLVCPWGDCHEKHDQIYEGIQGLVVRRLRVGLSTDYSLAVSMHADEYEETLHTEVHEQVE